MVDALKESKVRFQLDLTPTQAERFDLLMNNCELSSRKELFNVAMSLFYWAAQEASKGRKIASYDEEKDHVETIIVPALVSASLNGEAGRTTLTNSSSKAAGKKTFGIIHGKKTPIMSSS